ncbi:MAG TPA: hypothetical protein DEQ47_16770 [Solibacterales bacterium]|nr:hypothetical protein [Bryobacterales bacterium]
MLVRRRDFLAAGASGLLTFRGPARAAALGQRQRLTAIHTMVDTPAWAADPGKRFDPKKFLRLCLEARVEVIEFKTKNAVGDAMFPFRGRPCPRDWVTETRALAREAGIEFIAYYNVGLDNWMATQRPEWRCVDPHGKPEIAFGAFNWMCIRSPWRDTVIAELRQMEQALRPDGVWFDLLGAPNAYGVGSFNPGAACFCPYCKAAYQAKFGEEQPVSSEDPAIRLRVNRFGQEARVAMLRDCTGMLRSIDPKVELGYNGAGLYDDLAATPQDLRDLVTYNSSEAKQHRIISFTAKSLWALGKPFQVHTFGGFMRMDPGSVVGTWSAWNLIPAPYLEVSAAIISAHAGRIGLGVNPLPDGTVYDGEFQRAGQVLSAVVDRERWLAGLTSVPNVAVVYDAESELRLLPLPATKGQPVREETTGLHDALADAGIHFDVVQSSRLDTAGYKAILLGNAVCPTERLRATLTRFVRGGGILIATDETSLRDAAGRRRSDFGWPDLLGVRWTGTSPYAEANYAWLGDDLRGDAPAYPLLFRAPVLEVQCTTAVKLAELVYPEGHRTPRVFTDGETPYTHFKQFTGKPVVTLNRVGRGAVIYISAPIGREIATRQDPWLKRLVARCVTHYATGLAIEMQAPTGIQVVFGRKPGMSVVSLVNYYGGLAPGTDEHSMPQVGPVRLTVRHGNRPVAVRLFGGHGLDWKYRDGAIDANIQTVGHHALLIVT